MTYRVFTPDAHPGRLRLAGSFAWASGILELDYRPWAADLESV